MLEELTCPVELCSSQPGQRAELTHCAVRWLCRTAFSNCQVWDFFPTWQTASAVLKPGQRLLGWERLQVSLALGVVLWRGQCCSYLLPKKLVWSLLVGPPPPPHSHRMRKKGLLSRRAARQSSSHVRDWSATPMVFLRPRTEGNNPRQAQPSTGPNNREKQRINRTHLHCCGERSPEKHRALLVTTFFLTSYPPGPPALPGSLMLALLLSGGRGRRDGLPGPAHPRLDHSSGRTSSTPSQALPSVLMELEDAWKSQKDIHFSQNS